MKHKNQRINAAKFRESYATDPVTNNTRRRQEKDLQYEVAEWLKMFYPFPKYMWTHIPSGELRNPVVARQLKLMGVNKGFPDIMFFNFRLAVDLKKKGKMATKEQQIVMNELTRLGWECHLAYSLEEFQEIVWSAKRRSLGQ